MTAKYLISFSLFLGVLVDAQRLKSKFGPSGIESLRPHARHLQHAGASRGLFHLHDLAKTVQRSNTTSEQMFRTHENYADMSSFFDLIRDRVKEQAPDVTITDEAIFNVFLPFGSPARMPDDGPHGSRSFFPDDPKTPAGVEDDLILSNSTHLVEWDPSRQLDESQCVVDILDIIVGAVAACVCLLSATLCAVGRKIGQSALRKLRSNGRTEILQKIQRFTNKPTDEEAGGALFDIFGTVVEKIGVSALMDSIGSNIQWYEWIIIAIGLIAELILIIVPGGSAVAFAARLVALAAQGATIAIDILEASESCAGVDRISCGLLPGYDFFEQQNSFDFSLPLSYPNDPFENNRGRCDEYRFLCKGFNSDGWLKYDIQPYDEWISYPDNGNCRGIFIKEGTNICRTDVAGYVFYEDYNSAGNNILQVGGTNLLDVANECNSRGDDCQGFNTDRQIKSQVKSVDQWSDIEGVCAGIFVKRSVDVCPEAPGYKFYRGFDSSGSASQVDGIVSEISSACDVMGGDCQGFNSTGSLKQTIAPFIDWIPIFSILCVGLFVPDSFEPDCSIEGYIYFENLDSPGNDIEQRRESSIRDLAEACDNDFTCEAFNSLGILKYYVTPENQFTRPKSLAGECQGLYVKAIALQPPRYFCNADPTTILLSNKGTRDFQCDGAPFGQTKLAWETIPTTSEGFEDDEYYIHLFQENQELYRSVEQFWDTPGMADESNIVGSPGVTGYRVQFRCNNFLSACGDGQLQFVLVDCGCQNNEVPLLPCRADSVSKSRNAICPSTPSPTTQPSTSPSLLPSPSPTEDFVDPGTFCEGGPEPIDLGNSGSSAWECSGRPHGQVKIIWQTVGVSSAGFNDDEYIVQLFQEDQEVYRTEEQVSIYQSSGDSGPDAVGITGRGGYRVTYQCTLDSFFNDCEGGTFAFKLVDCGCPNGDDPILDCAIRNFEVARNAVCQSTPSPTRSPTNPDDDDDGGGLCFSGETTVTVQNHGVIPISDVKVGDAVLVSENGRYDTVYTLMKANREAEGTFTQIFINGTATPLELTHHHLLWVNGHWKQAANVAVGDLFDSVQGHSEVTQIKTVRRKGFYAPFTFSGTIMANGVKASVFAGPETIHFGKTWNSGLDLHSVLQWLLSYHRLVCRINLDWCRRESHTEFGVSRMVEMSAMAYSWVQSQNGLVGLVLLGLLLAFALVANFIEFVLCHWLAVIAIGVFWLVRKQMGEVRRKRSKP